MNEDKSRLIQLLTTSTIPHDIPVDPVVIIDGVRTPLTRAKRGGLKDYKADQLLAAVLKELLQRVNLPGSFIGDIAVGNVLQPGAGATMSRMAMFEADMPVTVPVYGVNRQCASGLQAIASIADSVHRGTFNCGIAAGVESMTHSTFESAMPVVSMEAVKASKDASACMVPMGITSENVAKQFNISRAEQDAFSLSSHKKAADARRSKVFEREIVAVGGVTEDDGIREDASLAALSKLKPAFQRGGSSTAGNSSQVTDGAAAVLVARSSFAAAMGLPVLGIFRSYAVVGVPPGIMGVGPAYAIPVALRNAGLTLKDIDVFEINEAFASQCLYCVRHLGIPIEKVNPYGGAIAMGHPLGCSGTRLVVTLLHGMKRTGKRYGVVSLCMGTGMGAAAVYENPDYFNEDTTSQTRQLSSESHLHPRSRL